MWGLGGGDAELSKGGKPTQGSERARMRAVVITRAGGPEVLEAREVEEPPALGEGEVLLEVLQAASFSSLPTIVPPARRR